MSIIIIIINAPPLSKLQVFGIGQTKTKSKTKTQKQLPLYAIQGLLVGRLILISGAQSDIVRPESLKFGDSRAQI